MYVYLYICMCEYVHISVKSTCEHHLRGSQHIKCKNINFYKHSYTNIYMTQTYITFLASSLCLLSLIHIFSLLFISSYPSLCICGYFSSGTDTLPSLLCRCWPSSVHLYSLLSIPLTSYPDLYIFFVLASSLPFSLFYIPESALYFRYSLHRASYLFPFICFTTVWRPYTLSRP